MLYSTSAAIHRTHSETMGSTHPAVLLFGDVTEAWVDGMDYVCGQATTTPWLRSFLGDLFSAFTAEVREMDRFLRESFGVCSNFQELAQKYRHSGDEVGMVHAMLLYAVRAALLLECVFFLSLARTLTSGTRVSSLLNTDIAKDRKPRAAVAQPWRRQTRNTSDRHLWRSVERRFCTDFYQL